MPIPQDQLRKLWHTAAPGRLAPWQQARALALRDVSRDEYGGHVCVSWIAAKLRKTDETGEAYSNEAPAQGSVSEFFSKVDNDPDWFPGKHSGEKRGPPPALTRTKRQRIASSAMRQKADGDEPSADVTRVRCPAATLNPATKKPFCDKTIRKVFLEDCYDFNPECPWKYQYPLQKRYLPADVREHRLAMARHIMESDGGDSVAWWSRNVLWIDPCASILPRTRLKYDRMRQAERGNKKRMISDDAKAYARNLRGSKEHLKQNSFDAEQICWLVVVARGVVAVEVLPEGWEVDGAGMADAVKLLPGVLRRMLGEDALLPRVLFTDRGTGMYAANGYIVREFANAVDAAGFRTYWGSNAKTQAPDMGDLLLHETAVSWFRSKMRREKPAVLPWRETRAQWKARAARCVRAINAEYNVAGLCREFPARLLDCQERGGDRIPK